ncbi:MAG: xanthine dehydrogenase small subunit [Meiothermus sp.]
MQPIRFTLNGKEVTVQGVDPHTNLLSWLRQNGLTGSKEGCAEGECGACAVALVRQDAQGRTRYESVNSCLVLMPMVHAQEVVTVEHVGSPENLHPVQAAMTQGGSQCGYCTPGFVVSLFAEYYRPGRVGFDLEALGGNLCRCTGYRPIRDAALSLGNPDPEDPFCKRLEGPAPSLGPLEYTLGGRRFYRPTTLQGLFDVLQVHPQAKLIAGGTDLVVESNLRFSRWDTLVSVEAIPEMGRIEWDADNLEIGAAVPLGRIEEELRGRLPLLEALWPLFASRLLRNRATLGGNLGTASPIGDSPPVLLALRALVRVASARGQRLIPIDEFFTGYRKTALQPGEVILAVQIPRPFPEIGRFYKVAKRHRDDISTVAGAFALDLADNGTVSRIRIAYGGVAATPIRAQLTELALVGKPWNLASVQAATRVLATEFRPISDHRGSAEYRTAMVVKLLEKFFYDSTLTAEAAV